MLVTGGAGFIGSFAVEALLKRGHQVTILDCLEPQVHGTHKPEIPAGVTFIRGDVGNRSALLKAAKGVTHILHLAAAVGVGQSMYEIQRYVRLNTYETAFLLENLVRTQKIKKLVVASSMSIYGEGAYRAKSGSLVTVPSRPSEQLQKHQWEARHPAHSREILRPIPTPETLSLRPTSIYAITKRDQEEMCLTVGQAYGVPSVAMRFFNVYGPRQALSNPYTGVAAIFSSRLLNGKSPVIYEDGLQSRDFVHVSDIVEACCLALESPNANFRALNVGTGRSLAVREIAVILAKKLGHPKPYVLADKFRTGDIRHCFADISLIRKTLGFTPKVRFEDGIDDLVQWVRQQKAVDRTGQAARELERKGLVW